MHCECRNPRIFVSAATGPLAAASARTDPPSEFSTYFSDSKGRKGLEIAFLAPAPTLRCQNTASVSSGVLGRWTTFRSLSKSRIATLDSERHWTPLDLETCSIFWALKRLRGYCEKQNSAHSPATRHYQVESVGKVETYNARIQL